MTPAARAMMLRQIQRATDLVRLRQVRESFTDAGRDELKTELYEKERELTR